MTATQELHNLGQSLWLDNITRDLLDNGTLKRYIDEFSITGLTSNPTIFEHAISKSKSYDAEIGRLLSSGLSGEELFFELALQDLTRAADLFAAVHERTAGNDGFVSLEVSPLLAYDTKGSVAAATSLHKKANRPNLFIKIPGTREGNPAIEEAIATGVAINVTLLFSREHYLASADAYMRGTRTAYCGWAQSRCSVGCLNLLESMGRRYDGQSARPIAGQTRHRHRSADLQGLPRCPSLGSLAAIGQLWRAAPEALVCQYGHQGPKGFGRSLYRSSCCAKHDRHDSRENPPGFRRPRQADRNSSSRWRRL